MEDEKGMDEKVLAVLSNDPAFYHIKALNDLGAHKLDEIANFFQTYKSLEKNKWAKVGGWKNHEETLKFISVTHESFKNEKEKTQTQLMN